MIDLRLGDCLDIMRGMDAESVDAVVTDPPYGLSFMGKDWDHGVPGVHFWSEALRLAKPGAYLLAFGGTRTYHRLVCAIEDAGFEIRDTIEWVYGSGFPKSLDVSKAIDKAAGAEREIVGGYMHGGTRQSGIKGKDLGQVWHSETSPATDAAREWSGWGTALKPAHEPIVVARKPLSEATVVANVLRWGTGALNVDAGRIATNENDNNIRHNEIAPKSPNSQFFKDKFITGPRGATLQGRFPANLITDGSAEVVAMFPNPHGAGYETDGKHCGGKNAGYRKEQGAFQYSGDANRFGDTGSAARFFKSCPLDEDDYLPMFYCAKASKAERDAGCEDLLPIVAKRTQDGGDDTRGRPTPVNHNHHPTVKPLSLMRYLITLCTREGATVLDPFMGSGTTDVACVQLNRNFIGCEIDPDYYEIAKRRIEAAQPVAIELPLMAEA